MLYDNVRLIIILLNIVQETREQTLRFRSTPKCQKKKQIQTSRQKNVGNFCLTKLRKQFSAAPRFPTGVPVV